MKKPTKKPSTRKSATKPPMLSNQPPEPKELVLQKQQEELAKKRAERCFVKLQRILKEDNCTIQAVPYFSGDGRTKAQWMVIPE